MEVLARPRIYQGTPPKLSQHSLDLPHSGHLGAVDDWSYRVHVQPRQRALLWQGV